MFKEVTTMFLKKHIKNVTQLPKKLFKKVNVFQRNIGIHGSNQVHTKKLFKEALILDDLLELSNCENTCQGYTVGSR